MTVETKLKEMQDSWMSKKADEVQSFEDRKDMKFFDALNTVYGHQTSGTTPLLSADGTNLLTDKGSVLKRWAEHFDGVLNRPSFINDEAINRLPQVECNQLLDEFWNSESNKTPVIWRGSWIRCIPAEIYKAEGPPVAETDRIISTLRGEKKPSLKKSRMRPLHQENSQICDNRRGISLLSIAGKILARVLLNPLNEHLEQ